MSLFGRYNSAVCTQFRLIEENMYVYLGAEHNMIFIKTQMVRAKITITTGD